MCKQTCLEKGLSTETSAIKIVNQIQANFNQFIFPQSTNIFILWKFEQEDERCIAIQWLFSISHLSIQGLSIVRPSSWTWTWSHWQEIANSKQIKCSSSSQDFLKTWLRQRYNPFGGSRAGTVCVLYPIFVEWWHTWCCQPFCGQHGYTKWVKLGHIAGIRTPSIFCLFLNM